MYIKKLELLNFQVIEKFEAEFNGNVYFVTGDNELGKSTLLKAIGALLTGQRDDVLRNGASKGFAKMVVGDDGEEYDVQLSFTEANPRGTLTIKQKTTGMATNNVSMLQRIFGYQDFDAVEFSRWSETAEGRRKQIAVVKALLPEKVRTRIDEIDATVSELKTERTGVNRDVKTFAGFVETIAKQMAPGDVEKYAEPVDVTELMERQKTNAQLIEKAKTVRAAVAQRTQQLAEIPNRMKEIDERLTAEKRSIDETVAAAKAVYEKAIADAKIAREKADAAHAEAIATIEAERKAFAERKENGENWLAKYEANNPENTNVPALLAEAEAHNKRYHLVCQFKEKKTQYDGFKAKAEQMDADIAKLADERAALIANAKLPIAGLSFTDDGLELNGVPFVPGKVSDSQTMEIAAKLVIASNPKVKVFRIARGESLGQKRLETIIDIARRNGFQGFLENVVRGQEELRIEEYTER
jgi:energy-coupling factor transporter ATP-binding protein EcfA2